MSLDPSKAAGEARKLLVDAQTTGECVRARITEGWAAKLEGRSGKLEDALERAAEYPDPGELALAQLETHRAEATGDVEAKHWHAHRAVQLAEPLALAAPPLGSSRFDPTAVVPRSTLAAALIARAQAWSYLGRSDRVLGESLTALDGLIDVRFAPHVYTSALSALAFALMEKPSVSAAKSVLKLCDEMQRAMRKRVARKSATRARVEIIRALAMMSLGSTRWAADHLECWLDILTTKETAHRLVAEHLVWILANIGEEARAAYHARRHGLEIPVASETLDDEEDNSPIGF